MSDTPAITREERKFQVAWVQGVLKQKYYDRQTRAHAAVIDAYESRLQQLEEATRWLLEGFERSLAGRPIRCADEIVSRARAALGDPE